jgi:hypothetical protein
MKMLEFLLAAIIIFILAALYLFGSNSGVVDEKSCITNSDCACGVNINTGDCFFGNRNFVDETRQCPDFCTGIAGNLQVVCVNKACIHRRAP